MYKDKIFFFEAWQPQRYPDLYRALSSLTKKVFPVLKYVGEIETAPLFHETRDVGSERQPPERSHQEDQLQNMMVHHTAASHEA